MPEGMWVLVGPGLIAVVLAVNWAQAVLHGAAEQVTTTPSILSPYYSPACYKLLRT